MTTDPPQLTDPPKIEVELDFDRRVHYAMQQNDVRIIKRLVVHHRGGAAVENPAVRVAFRDAELAAPVVVRLARLAPGDSVRVDPLVVQLDGEALRRRTERQRTELVVTVGPATSLIAAGEANPSAATSEPVSWHESGYPIDVLSLTEWAGLRSLPELLAAFVLPNRPELDPALVEIAAALRQRTGDGALDGYSRRDPRRVVHMLNAVYDTLAARGIGYILPPPSFEREGQKVRLTDQVLGDHPLGTCLDLTLVFAAVLERMGLHPVLLLVEGHAFVGCWTQAELFSEATTEDGLRVRKRVDLDDIVVLDAVALTAEPRPKFAQARTQGARFLADLSTFQAAIDVARSRRLSIRPLPLGPAVTDSTARPGAVPRGQPSTSLSSEPPAVGSRLDHEPREPAQPELERPSAHGEPSAGDPPTEERSDGPRSVGQPVPSAEPSSPRTADDPATARLDHWQRKLLDLTFRNRLVNFRETKASLELSTPSLAELEDALATGRPFHIMPRPELVSQAEAGRVSEEDALPSFLREELADRRVYSMLVEDALEARLLAMWRHARAAIQESGANSLYLALGTLLYYESESSETARRAPILLLPMRIERQSASRGGFRIALADEEPHVNATLLEKLGSEYPIDVSELHRLEPDDSGLDVDAVLRRFRQAILHIDRWDVVEEAWIAPFSFTKFLMWLDLENRRSDLLAAPVLRRLLRMPTPEDSELEAVEADAQAFVEPSELDRTIAPADILTPMDADSSQLRSVVAAAAGRSFVLEGPPGTGKSQTITNLIAHCIGQGQRVLFVAEKQAALEVVKRRLDRVGLGAFCLELHSQKASKRAVIQQLVEPIDAVGHREPADWRAEASALERSRIELNDYVDELHRPGPFGESAFEVLGRLASPMPAALESHALTLADSLSVGELDPEWIRIRTETVGRLRAAREPLSAAPVEHPLRAVRRSRTEARLGRQAQAAIELATDCCDAFQRGLDRWLHRAMPTSGGIDPQRVLRSGADRRTVSAWVRYAELLAKSPRPQRIALATRDREELTEALDHAIQSLGRATRSRQRALALFCGPWIDGEESGTVEPASIATVLPDDTEWWERARRAERSVWPLSWWRGRSARRALGERLRDGVQAPRDLPTVVAWFETLVAAQRADRAVRTSDHGGVRWLGRAWRDALAEISKLQAEGDDCDTPVHLASNAVEWVQSMRKVLETLTKGALQDEVHAPDIATETARELWLDWSVEEDSDCAEDAAHLCSVADAWHAARLALDELLDLDDGLAWTPRPNDAVRDARGVDWLRHCRQTLDELAENLPHQLDAWCHWRRVRDEAEKQGLTVLVDSIAEANLDPADALGVLERAYRHSWIEHAFDTTPRLGQFHSGEHQRRIESFSARDLEWMHTTSSLLRARLASHVPRPHGSPSGASEVGILLREAKKKSRHLPVRRLFAQLPNLLPRLKPCFLMSPLSVAQFLDTSVQQFDLVVFDEASQITPWDAVGAMARGRASIVVGDSKQLPPTNFFQRGGDTEDEAADDLDFEELESILDECSASGLPALRLRWHYRSRHESLIAFSNHHYYGNDLLTFPSPALDSERAGVRWIPVPDGTYDRSKSRTNRAEAESVVRDVLIRLRDPDASSSIGVVTFSRAQQALIEDLLDAERRRDPSLERWFTDDDRENVFVKNLENVQGDERDTILFSICYGPDSQGRVAMNFGPLNVAGGERRLNVAITRARYRVLVHSTLRADQIDLARTRAVGVAHLKSFLEYAERGASALDAATDWTGDREHESPFERQVARALRRAGHDVIAQVGCSGYRIDLAVRDPERPGRLLLGIECDGAAYHSAKTARDRDRLRQSVLEGLGWQLCRVWSTDWWRSPDREIERLNAAIQAATEARRMEDRAERESLAAIDPGAPEAASADDPSGPGDATTEPERYASPTVRAEPTATVHEAADPPSERTQPPPSADEQPTVTYRATALERLGSPEAFGCADTFDPVVVQVVEQEGPISVDLLGRRLAPAWDVARITQRVREALAEALDRLEAAGLVRAADGFVWPSATDPNTWRAIRIPGNDPATERDADDLPVQEVANAVEWVVTSQVALPIEELVREVSRLFGFARVGSRVRESVEAGLQEAARADRVRLEVRGSPGTEDPRRQDLVVAAPRPTERRP